MKFLNEIGEEFPSAISLAAGRPTDHFAERFRPGVCLDTYAIHESQVVGSCELSKVRARVLQYGATAGFINELVAQQLRIDEGVPAHPSRVLITAGCQEALALCLPALCPGRADVALVLNPTYVGATAAARANGVEVVGISSTHSDLVEAIEDSVCRLREQGRRARALYLIPTFDNPTGRVLEEAQRRAILATCIEHCIVVLEDNPYGMFRYDGPTVPPLAALDEAGCVIYLSTFSKTIAPALRVGAATLPETLFGDRAAASALWQELVERKSYMTLNTSQITQAMVAGLLLLENGSLQLWTQPALAWYRSNRDAMLGQLRAAFSTTSSCVRWNHPAGGFFVAVDLPFRFDRQAVIDCATNYGVIVMPMSFFALDNSQDFRIRLSFSAVDQKEIRTGISSIAENVASRLEQESPLAERAEAV